MRRVLFAMLVTLAVPIALLIEPTLTPFAGAVGTVTTKPKPPTTGAVAVKPRPITPAQRHAAVIASVETRDIAADARAVSVSVAGLRNEWQHVAICEVSGNWSMIGPVYSGIGFLDSSWDAYGGTQFAPRAGYATEDEQIVVGMRITGNWVPDQDGCDPGGW